MPNPICDSDYIHMSLEQYFLQLIEKVENSETVTNQGKDRNGFFKPNRTIALTQLKLLKDLHNKPLAKPMLRDAWRTVVEILPPEYLILNSEQKAELKKILE